MSRCMACNKILSSTDYIIDELGELCKQCLGVVNTTVHPELPISNLSDEEE